MLVFPNSKINLGLYITEKRSDNYHNLETVFYPVKWQDSLEIIENKTPNAKDFKLIWHLQQFEIPLQEQLIYKAWLLVKKNHKLPPIEVHLLKNIPSGAGLGGGSSDGAHMIRLLDQKFKLGLTLSEKLEMAASLGSDCAFFIQDLPQYACGKGEILSPCKVSLSQYYFVLIYPEIHCNTTLAYQTIKPQKGRKSIPSILQQNPLTWKTELINDFEESAFKKYPLLKSLKNQLYAKGAIYSSMSGSGSSLFGLFKELPDLSGFQNFKLHISKPEM